MTSPKLLSNDQLAQSAVVANARMNRERRLIGRGGYEAELRFGIISFLMDRLMAGREAAWLDLCCGTARALVDAAEALEGHGLATRLRIVGVDLVAHRVAIGPAHRNVEFHEASLAEWSPSETFDLITCVHGLHYLGDKLGIIARAADWLKPDGSLLANVDLGNILHERLTRFGPHVTRWLRSSGFEWHRGFRRLTCDGHRTIAVPWEYAGADDTAGPNFTGQPVVNSWYRDAAGTSPD